MPGSLIIFGDTFSLLRKDDIQLIFEFYQNGRIEDVFLNKAVLEVDWDLLYFKMDRTKGSIVPCKYPISATEAFLDRFMHAFFLQPTSRTFSLDLVMESAQKLDTIDLEMTLDFLRKTLNRCQLDLDRNQYLFANFYTDINIPFIKGLNYRMNFGNNSRTSQRYTSSQFEGNLAGRVSKANQTYYDYTLDNILTYSKNFKKHDVSTPKCRIK